MKKEAAARCANQFVLVITYLGLPNRHRPASEDRRGRYGEGSFTYSTNVITVDLDPDGRYFAQVGIGYGTDRRSRTVNTYEKTSRFMLDYMVKTRGLDPRRIQIVKGSERQKTTYVLWVVPPGATPPVP